MEPLSTPPSDRLTLQDWSGQVVAALGLPAELAGQDARDVVLDLARDVAHGVSRPAAPVTAFLLGAAVGAGRTPAQAAAEILALLPAQP